MVLRDLNLRFNIRLTATEGLYPDQFSTGFISPISLQNSCIIPRPVASSLVSTTDMYMERVPFTQYVT